jgi:hypothetical protein
MKIEISNSSYVRLCGVLSGETFQYDDEIYIKGDKRNTEISDSIICIRLCDGHSRYFLDEDMVIPVKAKVVVE